ncbi:MAG TPA: iron chelate uptake ABC transporter family permease subunit [Mesorhizobium sp.]|jgi:iron complex transport system permease protein|uniref:FecCD family ABC transporter permease n=1 Tax=Mesorhizobium sp. TaxID=1871066 RepID=UPI002DDD4D24|nr:iron chelate uptake ABC transporter family permease subunit [Mesorhizobium sp.]HEV2505051.1 iron chelate uptake ABC transporter family permease subunit [Mesorhizobium sp.]
MRHSAIGLRVGGLSLHLRPRAALVCTALALTGLALGVLLLGTGTLHFSPSEVIDSLLGAGSNPTAERIVLRVRLPRLATAMLVGASLGMAGAIFQSLSRNALGSPDIIGFTTGAATGAILQIVLFDAGPLGVSLAAFASCIATAVAVLLLSMKHGTTGGYRLVLVGVGIGAILSGINTLLLVKGGLDQAAAAQLWLAGSLNTRTWAHVIPAAIGFAAIVPIVVLNARQTTLLEMGDDIASQLGVVPERTRLTMLMAAVGLTAIATAAAGPIAFVALAGPQLARRLTSSPGLPLLSGALMGAVLLLLADLVSQRAPFHVNMPVGLTTGMLGGLYLLWLLMRKRTI